MNLWGILGATAGAIAVIIAAIVTGYFGVRLKRTPDPVAQRQQWTTEFKTLMEERNNMADRQDETIARQQVEITRLTNQNNDQSAEIRILRRKQREAERKLEQALEREAVLEHRITQLEDRS